MLSPNHLTLAERKLLVFMLKKYGDVLGDNGCNDFDLPKEVFTSEEEAELRGKYIECIRGDRVKEPDPIGYLDFVFLDMLTEKIEKGAG